MARTKIVCTLGPACRDSETLVAMIEAGMTVARLNFSHGSADEKRAWASAVRAAAARAGRYVALMGDLQGPKIRVGRLPDEGVPLVPESEVTLTASEAPEADAIPFPHPDIVADLQPGHHILLDDGSLELVVTEVAPPRVRCRVLVGGILTSNKGVNLPGTPLKLSALTPKDREDARLALELGLDYLALSFVRRAEDVHELREYLLSLTDQSLERRVGEDPNRLPAIVAKIEKPEALQELEAIVRAADAVMVARGDLGVETAPQRVPLVQKDIIRLCNQLGKPVITATQMLQSMIENPRPTRAEASDVANALLDGSDAIMLSGETSVGRYPVAAVRTMASIAEAVEQSDYFPYNQLLGMDAAGRQQSLAENVSRAISRATVEIAADLQAAAILCSTESGRTARMVARHRPRTPLLGITPFESTARRLNLVWGVTPVVVVPFKDTDHMLQTMVQAATQRGYARCGDPVVLTAGIPLEVHGVTNMLKVHTIGEDEVA